MLVLPRAIVVGATSRNCGKTSFINQLIERFAGVQPVAVKIKTIYHGDTTWHGKGTELLSPFIIREETSIQGLEDSKRFLNAGASRVYYVKSYSHNLSYAMEDLLAQIALSTPLIIESNSVMDVIKPAAFFMITQADSSKYKPSALRLMDKADILIKTDGESHFPPASELSVSWNDNRWHFS